MRIERTAKTVIAGLMSVACLASVAVYFVKSVFRV